MSDLSSFPEAPPISIRCEPDYYGAAHLIAQSLELAEPPLSGSSWVHGCDMFPMPRAVFSPHFTTPEQTHLVGNLAAERWWRDKGYSRAVAVGCPFIYTSPSGRSRIPGSVLAMPNHGLPGSTRDREHAIEWLEVVKELRQKHPHIVVCLHADDVAELRPFVEQAGLQWITGAKHDTLSLPTMRAMFESFEFMITDVQGSHIPYASWCGCKVMLLEPLCVRKWEHFENHPHMLKHPELKQNLVFNERENICQRLPFLFADTLEQALCPREWAAVMLGTDSKRTPEELARLLGWQADDPALPAIAYEDAARWLGASNPNTRANWLSSEVAKWKSQHASLKAEHKAQGDLLRKARKDLEGRQPYLDSFSSKLGRGLYSIEKRLKPWFGKREG
jgi:hypothetical protein